MSADIVVEDDQNKFPVFTPSPLKTTAAFRKRTEITKRKDPSENTSPRDRIMYLQALFPYATYDQLLSIVDNTNSAEEAAQHAFEALNPDFCGYSYLKEQHDLSHNKKVSKAERTKAFNGLSETLEERAEDLFKDGQYGNLSHSQEYNFTVQAFAVDTSEWDAAMLPQVINLENAMFTRLSFLPDKQEKETTNSASFSPEAKPSGYVFPTGETDGSDAEAKKADSAEVFIDGDVQEPLSAPLVRWAPLALRVGPAELEQNHDDMLRVFDEAQFFPNPFFSEDGSFVNQNSAGSNKNNDDTHDNNNAPDVAYRNNTDLNSNDFSKKSKHEHKSEEGQEHGGDEEGPRRRTGTEVPQSARSRETHEPFDGENSGTDAPALQESKTSRSTKQAADAARILEERKKRNDAPDVLQNRVRRRKPLGDLMFQPSGQEDPLTDSRQRNSDSRNEETLEQTRLFPVTGAKDVMNYLNAEEEHWKKVLNFLFSYEEVYDTKCRCEIVDQIYLHCPRLVANINTVFVRLLGVAEKELRGRVLVREVSEIPLKIPIFGSKLCSTGPIAIRRLELTPEKCFAKFVEGGSRLCVRVYVRTLELEPVSYAYISEKNALRQSRRHEEESKHVDRRSSAIMASPPSGYDEGTTRGQLDLKASKVCITLEGGAWLLSSGRTYLIVEKTSVKIGSLDAKTTEKKLNIMLTLGKCCLKQIVKNAITSFAHGVHSL